MTRTWWWTASTWPRMNQALASSKSFLDLWYSWEWVKFSITRCNNCFITQADEPTHIAPYHAEEATSRHEEQGFKGTGLLSNWTHLCELSKFWALLLAFLAIETKFWGARSAARPLCLSYLSICKRTCSTGVLFKYLIISSRSLFPACVSLLRVNFPCSPSPPPVL